MSHVDSLEVACPRCFAAPGVVCLGAMRRNGLRRVRTTNHIERHHASDPMGGRGAPLTEVVSSEPQVVVTLSFGVTPMAKRNARQQSMPGMEHETPRREYPPSQRAVGAFCRGWKAVRSTQPPKEYVGRVGQAAKRMVDEGRAIAVVIEAAERCGRRGHPALAREVGDLEAARAAYDAAQSLGEANQRGL